MIYLDNASTTFPKPESVYRAIYDSMIQYGANPGRSWHAMAKRISNELFEARKSVAKLFSIPDPNRVVFSFNATEAIKMVYGGLLNAGDHVIVTSMEHKAMLRPLQEMERLGIYHTVVHCSPAGELDLSALSKAIQKGTKLIGLTGISNVTGTVMPIAEVGRICRDHGLLFMVDASQAGGVLDIDVGAMNIDLLVASGHKSLFGMQGTGVVYISPRARVRPYVGHVSEEEIDSWLFYERYEIGTLNAPGILGMKAGVDFILLETTQKIRAHEQMLTRLMLEGLRDVGNVVLYGPLSAEKQLGIVTLNIMGKPPMGVAELLDERYGIGVRPGLHCATYAHETIGTGELGGVRFSMGYFNTIDDIEAAVSAVKSIAGA
ncbi:cysteine desulfurase family protein [Sporobacter termitidis DSM 10068]|uniref:cysteine desulfurase n=1 Tax=Sporobacter termitidis DSM 10068 TaxID=1123282 RepID=A0A1M5XDK2_9FIRM|nr:aminotransferase class V-fold PLP-dependent enzyme [Sporobacter termitidis]SHH97618.1 cysteine desulfurase family protein [Sporobacter termitidis DSM 10068]